MKVLLVYPDFFETVGGTPQHGSYSEGIASLSAMLRAHGHATALFHITAPIGREAFRARIEAEQPDVVAFSVRTSIFPFVRDYVVWTRGATDAFIVCGGYHPTLRPDEVIEMEGVDAICIGEGEYPLAELCEGLERSTDISHIESLWVKQRGGRVMHRNPVRPLIEDLDELPLPDLELFDFENLTASSMRTANVMMSRGCPYRCSYCCNEKLKAVYPNPTRYARFRSPRRSIDFLKLLKDKFPFVQYLNFMDNILPLKRKWFYEFAELYRREVALPFACRDRPDLLSRKILETLKEMGCYLIHIGVESGSDHIRNEILSRNLTRDQIKQAFEVCHELGISPLSYNIINAPHESLQTSLQTIKLNAELRPNRMTATVCYPYPNTGLYDIAVRDGLLDPDFDYTDEVPIHNPGFDRTDVLFVQRSFRTFVALYRIAFGLPGPLRNQLEKLLDSVFLDALTPRSLLVHLGTLQTKAISRTKVFLQKNFPGAYLALRDAVVRRS